MRDRRRAIMRLYATAILLVLAACGTDTPTGGGDEGDPVLALSAADAALAGTEGGPDPEATTLEVSNAGDGTLSGLAASVDYASGQPTGWLSADLSGTTAPASLALQADIATLTVGSYEATVDVSGTGVSAPETVTVTLVLDLSSPPVIEVTSPTRAAMLAEGTNDPSDVQITGTACHDSVPIESLTVNGEAIAVSGTNLCEPFDVTQSSEWGMSMVEVRAENAYGRAAEAVQSYLRSPEYYPASFTPDQAARVGRGVFARMNDPVIDDGDRGDFDDIATVVEAWVDAFDVNSGLPSSVSNPSNAGNDYVDDCGLWTRNANVTGIELSRTGSMTTGTRSVTLDASSAGLEASVNVPSLHAPARGEGWQDLGCLIPDLHAAVNGDIDIDDVTSTVTVNPTVTASGLDAGGVTAHTVVSEPVIDVDWGILDFLDFLVNGVVNLFSGAMGEALSSSFDSLLEYELPVIVEDLFESFEVGAAVPVNGADIAYEGPVDYIEFGGSSNGWAEFGLGVQVRPAGTAAHDTAPFGAILGASGTPAFSTGYDFGVGIADDLVNQVLWAAWQAGSFEVADVATTTGGTYPGLSTGMSPLLPPVVTTSSGAHHMDVQWGDLAFTGLADPATFGLPGFQTGDSVAVEAHATLITGMDIVYDATARILGATVGESDVRVEVRVLGDAVLDEGALATAFEAAITDYIEAALPSAVASVPLPKLDLSGFTGVPAGSAIRLQTAVVERDGRYTKLTGSVDD